MTFIPNPPSDEKAKRNKLVQKLEGVLPKLKEALSEYPLVMKPPSFEEPFIVVKLDAGITSDKIDSIKTIIRNRGQFYINPDLKTNTMKVGITYENVDSFVVSPRTKKDLVVAELPQPAPPVSEKEKTIQANLNSDNSNNQNSETMATLKSLKNEVKAFLKAANYRMGKEYTSLMINEKRKTCVINGVKEPKEVMQWFKSNKQGEFVNWEEGSKTIHVMPGFTDPTEENDTASSGKPVLKKDSKAAKKSKKPAKKKKAKRAAKKSEKVPVKQKEPAKKMSNADMLRLVADELDANEVNHQTVIDPKELWKKLQSELSADEKIALISGSPKGKKKFIELVESCMV